MTQKAEKLAEWILGQMQSDSASLLKAVMDGKFDLTDTKIALKDETIGQVIHEFLFLDFHLADLYVYEMLGAERESFEKYTIEKVLRDMGVEMDDMFISIYNNRIQEYSKYKKLLADKNEPFTGTLFWEFGKRISSLIYGTPDHVFIVTAVSGMVAQGWGNLWSLELLHKQ